MSARRLAPIALGAILLVVWAPVLFGVETFWLGDFTWTTTPLHAFGASELRAGRLPEWNPYLFGGIPHAANPLALTFAPTTLLYLFLDAWRAANLELVFGLFVAAFATYACARELEAGPIAAATAGAIFAFSGPMVASPQVGVHALAAAWLPLAVYGALFARRRWLFGGAIAAASLALMLLCGEPELVTVGALLVTACVLGAPELRGMRVKTLGLTAAAAVGLAAVQLFPAVAFAPNSVRSTGVAIAEAQRWSAHPLRFVGWIWPWPFGRIVPANSFWGGFLTDDLNDRTFMYASLYAGALALPLAVFGLLRHRLGRWLGAGALILALLALGRFTPLFALLHKFPPLKLSRYPERYLLPVGLIFALGVALALERWRDAPARALAALAGLIAIASAALALGASRLAPAIAARSPVPNAPEAVAQLRADGWNAAAVGAGFCLLTLLLRAGKLRPSLALIAAAAIVSGDVVLAGREAIATRPVASLPKENPTAEATQKLAGNLYRFWRMPELNRLSLPRNDAGWWRNYDQQRLTLRSDVPMMIGLKDAGGHSAARARVRFGADADLKDRFESAAREAAVRAIVTPWPLPPEMEARVQSRTLRVETSAPSLGVALLELPDAKPLVRCMRSKCVPDELLPGRVRAHVDLAGSDALELAENNLPGWRATVDGQETPILETAMGFVSVPLPAGKHTVELRYRAPGLRPGIAVTLLTALLLCAAFVLRRFRG